jgi:hypothetical protein
VTHLVYIHHHSDHAGGSSMFGEDVVRIGHDETRRLLLRDNELAKPGAEETFQDSRTLDIGGERIACVQNAFHLLNRASQPVLDECTRRGTAFVPFAPLGSGQAGPKSVLGAPVVRVAGRKGLAPAQVALAWALAASPTVLLIPGTSSVGHLHQNLAASGVHLDAEDLQDLASVSGLAARRGLGQSSGAITSQRRSESNVDDGWS